MIDSDQHLYETRALWADHIDPALREEALAIVDDEHGYPWLTWRDRRLDLADVQLPGDTAAIGRNRQRCRQEPAPRVLLRRGAARRLLGARAPGRSSWRAMGLDEAVLFPNFGLLVGASALGRRCRP